MIIVSCVGQNEVDAGSDIYELDGSIKTYGGRNKVLGVWSGIQDKDLTLRLVAQGGKAVEMPVLSEKGEVLMEGLPEGDNTVQIELQKDGKAVWKSKATVMVLGETYEKSLRPWECRNYSLSGNTFVPEFSKVVYGGLVGEEFVYTDLQGKEQTYYYEYKGATSKATITIKGVAGDVKSRSVYIPVPQTGDKFYTS